MAENMTFDDLEVGRWYWGRDHLDNWHRFKCVDNLYGGTVLIEAETGQSWYPPNVLEVTPVPSREEWELAKGELGSMELYISDLKSAIAKKDAAINEWQNRTLQTARENAYLRAACQYVIDNIRKTTLADIDAYVRKMMSEADALQEETA